ncbi:hypothetical protein TNCV_4714281 [Trichonephila clavipes]|nr:hypothetical protein TNCV_4714281 [Trichonephila clavipes]
MLGHQQVSPCKQFYETSSIWAFGAEGPLVYLCRLHYTNLYASAGSINTDIGLMKTRNTLPGLMSLVFEGIELMDVYGYGGNLMTPWTLYACRGLFKLVESL